MRILSFSEHFPKLRNPILFTTFRYPHRGAGGDWRVEEEVQIWFKAQSPKNGYRLGIARIIRIEEKDLGKRWSYFPRPSALNTADMISPGEAEADGFTGQHGGGDVKAMVEFIRDLSRGDLVNKLTLYWIEKA